MIDTGQSASYDASWNQHEARTIAADSLALPEHWSIRPVERFPAEFHRHAAGSELDVKCVTIHTVYIAVMFGTAKEVRTTLMSKLRIPGMSTVRVK